MTEHKFFSIKREKGERRDKFAKRIWMTANPFLEEDDVEKIPYGTIQQEIVKIGYTSLYAFGTELRRMVNSNTGGASDAPIWAANVKMGKSFCRIYYAYEYEDDDLVGAAFYVPANATMLFPELS